MKPRVMTVLGTRPEAIKLAPVVAELNTNENLDAPLVVTGQHREIADQVLDAFGLTPDCDLDLMSHGQGLSALTARALEGLTPVLEQMKPDLLLVQGDTTTTFAAALAAFYAHIPVAHVEAGLRTEDMSNPFPEEANRRLTSVLAELHLAPTPWSKANLIAERVPADKIVVTGNTVVDALETLIARPFSPRSPLVRHVLDEAARRPLIVVTTHRRENWGEPQERVARAVRRAAIDHPHALFFVPLHPNPIVRASLVPHLNDLDNVILSEPLEYDEMLRLLTVARLALTDSGGIQEEGCVLGVPILLLREVTERPEGVYAGVVRVVGTDERAIAAGLVEILTDDALRARMARPSGVFGDGLASRRTHQAICKLLGLDTPQIEEFYALQLASVSVP